MVEVETLRALGVMLAVPFLRPELNLLPRAAVSTWVAILSSQFCQFTVTNPVPVVGTVYVWFDPFSHVTVPSEAILMNLNWI